MDLKWRPLKTLEPYQFQNHILMSWFVINLDSGLQTSHWTWENQCTYCKESCHATPGSKRVPYIKCHVMSFQRYENILGICVWHSLLNHYHCHLSHSVRKNSTTDMVSLWSPSLPQIPRRRGSSQIQRWPRKRESESESESEMKEREREREREREIENYKEGGRGRGV